MSGPTMTRVPLPTPTPPPYPYPGYPVPRGDVGAPTGEWPTSLGLAELTAVLEPAWVVIVVLLLIGLLTLAVYLHWQGRRHG